ncbi:MAG: sulfatase-like hydrolase/transferase [Gemmataceae bacterium]|nr:sulfatase-like hydrolase/transferase [Gemmataceae bacterium]
MSRCLALLLAPLLACAPLSAQETRRPNIVVIVGDDMGYADVGFHGCADIPTPHLDALAKSGTRCASGYVSGPYCSPTRAGLLTGKYQTRFGHEFNPGNGPKQGLPLTEKTLANHLKAAGYRTALIGKWHLGSSADHHPQKRGFDEFYGFLGGAHDYFQPKGVFRGTDPAGKRDENPYLTDSLARESVDFITRNKNNPFFLYLAFNAVHTPLQADEARLKKYAAIADPKRRTYAAMMSAMDDAIGTVTSRLKDSGLDKNTLVFFFSDNGGPTMPGTTLNGSINKPLRGSKRTTLEGGVRVPFLAAWPNLLPHLQGKQTNEPHPVLHWRFGKQMAIRQGDWKLVRHDLAAEGAKGVSPTRLYHLKNDPGESTDLSEKHPDKVKELQTAWDNWNQVNAKPLWGGVSE